MCYIYGKGKYFVKDCYFTNMIKKKRINITLKDDYKI